MVISREILLGTEYMVMPRPCKSNYCLSCRRANLKTLRRALYRTMAGNRWRLVTLTFPHRDQDPDLQLGNASKLFKRFTKRARRLHRDVKYVRTIELHKSGHPHIHFVLNKYLPVEWIRTNWKDLGGGIVDIRAAGKCKLCHRTPPCEHIKQRRIAGYKQAARYLTEEIEKIFQDPYSAGYNFWKHRIRTVATSRNLQLKRPGSNWLYVRTYSSLTEAMTFTLPDPLLNTGSDRPKVSWTTLEDAFLIAPGLIKPEL